MLDKNDLLDSILRECKVCAHLFTKIPEGGLEYRPTPGQRNTLELLRYLSFCGVAATRTMVTGTWDEYKALEARASEMGPDEFPAAMERQQSELKAAFAEISDDDFANKEATLPWGNTVTLGQALLDLSLLWMCAYRMQLFLYCKAAGNDEINTANCWMGVDWKREEES